MADRGAARTRVGFRRAFRLTAIHPFGDGNVARRAADESLVDPRRIPPIAVRPEDRKAYLDALERGSLAEDLAPFQLLMHQRLEATLADYLSAVREAIPPA